MNSVHIDEKQFEFAFNRGRSIILIKRECSYEKIEPGSLVQIHCDSKTLIGVVLNLYDDFEEIKPSQREFCYPQITNHDNDMLLEIILYKTENIETTALVPATLLLYRNIQWLRHLQLNKRWFKYIPAKNTKENFTDKIQTIEHTIAYLRGDIDVETLFETLTHDQDDTYHFNDIIELLRFYSVLPRLNEFRNERLSEIEKTINEIKKMYSERKYLAIRQAAYDIHNVPEFIRTLNDYR